MDEIEELTSKTEIVDFLEDLSTEISERYEEIVELKQFLDRATVLRDSLEPLAVKESLTIENKLFAARAIMEHINLLTEEIGTLTGSEDCCDEEY